MNEDYIYKFGMDTETDGLMYSRSHMDFGRYKKFIDSFGSTISNDQLADWLGGEFMESIFKNSNLKTESLEGVQMTAMEKEFADLLIDTYGQCSVCNGIAGLNQDVWSAYTSGSGNRELYYDVVLFYPEEDLAFELRDDKGTLWVGVCQIEQEPYITETFYGAEDLNKRYYELLEKVYNG